MCYSQINNNKINRLHERCLRLIYNDKKSFFEDLLEKDGSMSIHLSRFSYSLFSHAEKMA